MQVDLQPQQSKKLKRKLKRGYDVFVEALVPVVVVLIFGFYCYAFAYRVVWRRVPSRAASITLLSIFGFLMAYVSLQWVLIHAYGPGRIHENYVTSSDDDPFMCDAQGYALWCTDCSQVKPNRAHHSSKLGYCVPTMDHFCIWIAAVIGQGNRKPFILFSFALSVLLLFVFVVLLVFQHHSYPDTMPLSIVLYILTALFSMFSFAVTFQHFKLLFKCQTTINNLRFSGKQDSFVNFPYDDDSRRVCNITAKGITVAQLFSRGVWKNTTDVMGPWWTWLLPTRPPMYEPAFNKALIEKFKNESEQERLELEKGLEESTSL